MLVDFETGAGRRDWVFAAAAAAVAVAVGRMDFVAVAVAVRMAAAAAAAVTAESMADRMGFVVVGSAAGSGQRGRMYLACRKDSLGFAQPGQTVTGQTQRMVQKAGQRG